MLVLLDRDGVINEDLDRGVNHLTDFRFIPRAIEAIVALTHAGFTMAICTNQSAIGKGWLTPDELEKIHHFMCSKIIEQGGKIDQIYCAPDHPDAPTHRRKPAPGMLQEALQHFQADPAETFFIGDALRDLEAAAAAGCPSILVRTGKGAALESEGLPASIKPVTIQNDLYDAVRYILRETT